MENIFEELSRINVNDKTEKKNGLTYLSWAFAVSEFTRRCPNMTYEIVKFNGLPYVYDPATGYMVYTRVTADGITREMWLPVMDGANKAMKAEPYEYTVKNPNFKYARQENDGVFRDRYGNVQPEYITKTCEAATMFDINKTIMRCLVKNLAMFGLGLYIYAGEDLPDEQTQEAPQTAQEPQRATEPAKASTSSKKKTKAPEKAQETPQEPQEQTEEKPARRQARPTDPITPEMASALEYRCQEAGIDTAALCKLYKVNSIGELRLLHLRNINENWEEVKKRLAKNEEGNK